MSNDALPRRSFMVTGSRNWTDRQTILEVLQHMAANGFTILEVGDCPTGADAIATEIWNQFYTDGLGVEEPHIHYADWTTHGKAAGPLRNQKIVDAKPEYCAAFPLPGSRGTIDAMKRASEAKIYVAVWNAAPQAEGPPLVR